MAIRREDIQQPVQIIVKKETSKGQRLNGHLSNPGRRCLVGIEPGSIVVIQRHTFIRKIADNQALLAGAVIISGIHAHARARAT